MNVFQEEYRDSCFLKTRKEVLQEEKNRFPLQHRQDFRFCPETLFRKERDLLHLPPDILPDNQTDRPEQEKPHSRRILTGLKGSFHLWLNIPGMMRREL